MKKALPVAIIGAIGLVAYLLTKKAKTIVPSPAKFIVSIVEIRPAVNVNPDQLVTIIAEICNTGNEGEYHIVDLHVQGTGIQRQATAYVSPGACVRVGLMFYAPSQVGTYNVDVGEERFVLTVKETSSIPNTIQLHYGWNEIVYTGATMGVAEATATIIDLQIAWYYNNETGIWESWYVPNNVLSTLQILKHNETYWIFVKMNQLWEVIE